MGGKNEGGKKTVRKSEDAAGRRGAERNGRLEDVAERVTKKDGAWCEAQRRAARRRVYNAHTTSGKSTTGG